MYDPVEYAEINIIAWTYLFAVNAGLNYIVYIIRLDVYNSAYWETQDVFHSFASKQ